MGLDVTGIGAVADLATTIISRLFPDKTEQERAQMAAALQIIQGQLDANKAEAASTNWFVAGARPFILWGCGFAMLYASLFEPLLRFVTTVAFHYSGPFPVIDATLTTQVLLGLLGLAGMRSVEKLKGAEGNR